MCVCVISTFSSMTAYGFVNHSLRTWVEQGFLPYVSPQRGMEGEEEEEKDGGREKRKDS